MNNTLSNHFSATAVVVVPEDLDSSLTMTTTPPLLQSKQVEEEKEEENNNNKENEKKGLLLPMSGVCDDVTTSTISANNNNSNNNNNHNHSYHIVSSSSRNNNNNNNKSFLSFLLLLLSELPHEMAKILFLALPTVVVQVNLYTLFPLAASVVGRKLSSQDLAGFGLGALMGNFACLSVLSGALTAADTLMPRAYAARQYKQVGVLVARTLLVCTILLFGPMIVLSQNHVTMWLLQILGTEQDVATLAANCMRWYIVGIPATTIFRTLQRFCIAQEHPWPPVQASIFATFLLHPYLLHKWVAKYGLSGSILAIVTSQYIMLLALIGILAFQRYGYYDYCYRCCLDSCSILGGGGGSTSCGGGRRGRPAFPAESWPQWTSRQFWANVLEWEPLWTFFSLGVGGVVRMSQWW